MTKHICVRKEKKLLNLLKVKYSYISLDGVTVEEPKKSFFSKKFKTHVLYIYQSNCAMIYSIYLLLFTPTTIANSLYKQIARKKV
jgi:predicted transposase YbfD/YdcC